MKIFGVKVFSIICMISFLTIALLAQDSSFVAKFEYLKNLDYRIEKCEPGMIEIDIDNKNRVYLYQGAQNPEDTIVLCAPDENLPTLSWISYDFAVYDESNFISYINSDKDDSKIKIPEAQEFFKYKYEGIFRSVRLASMSYQLKKAVVSDNKNYTAVLKKAKIRIKFSKSLPAVSNDVRKNCLDSFTKNIIEAAALNGKQASLFIDASINTSKDYSGINKWYNFAHDNSTTNTLIKLKVFTPGIQKIDYASLQAAGITPDNIKISTLRLYHNGSEIPIYIHQLSGGNFFSQEDIVFFYINEWDVWKTPYQTVWLSQNTDSKPPLRIPTSPQMEFSQINENFITTGEANLTQKLLYGYNPRIPPPYQNNKWYWQKIDAGFFTPISFTLEGIDPAQNNTFDLEMYFANTAKNNVSSIDIYLNEQCIEKFALKGVSSQIFKKSLPASSFRDGENTFAFYIPVNDTEGIQPENMFVGFKLKYNRAIKTQSGLTDIFTDAPKNPNDIKKYLIDKFKKNDAYCINVNNPDNPIMLSSIPKFSTSGQESGVIFGDLRPNNESKILKDHLIFFTKAAAKTPAEIQLFKLNPNENLLDLDNNYDTIIITHPKFLGTLGKWTKYLIGKGKRVKVVNVEKIYDIFNYGHKSDKAIYEFLAYAYYKWQFPKVQNVLLVGEASDLPSTYICHSDEVQEDLVPTYGYCNPDAVVRGDNHYSLITQNDIFPEFAIGRFSVDTPEELEAVIEKNIDYEMKPPAGMWKIRHAFITDDEPEFIPIAETYIQCGIPDFAKIDRIYANEYSYERFFRVFTRKRSSSATEKIIDEFDKGLLTCNYIGHGGPNIWSSERLFHILDIPFLTNKETPTFITSSSCDTGWLDYPEPPVRASMGELFVKAPNGGAIACFFPTGGASPAEHQFLMTFLHQGLNLKGLSTFGEACTYARMLFGIYRNNSYVLDQYALIGSPTETISFPQKVIPLQVSTKSIDLTKDAKITVSGDAGAGLWGLGECWIVSENKKEYSLNNSVRVDDGKFSFTSDVPKELELGQYNIVFFASNKEQGKDAIGAENIFIDKPKIEMNVIIKNMKKLYDNMEKVPISIEIENMSRLPIEKVELEMLDLRAEPPKPFLSQPFPLDARKRKIISLDWTAKTGAQYIKIRSRWINQGTEGEWIENKYIFPVSSDKEEPIFDVLQEAVATEPDPLVADIKPIFRIPLYNIGKHPLKNLEAKFFLGEGSQIGETNSFTSLPSGASTTLVFRSPKDFPAGKFKTNLTVTNKDIEKTENIPYIVDVKNRIDLIVVKDSLKIESEHFYPEETVYITGKIKNVSDIEVGKFYVEAFENIPWKREKVCTPAFTEYSNIIEKLKPGEEKEVKIRWDRNGNAAPVTIYFIVNSKKSIPETDYSNNVASQKVEFKNYGNLKISVKLLNKEQTFIHRGSIINAEWTVEASGDYPFTNIPVDITLNNPFDKPIDFCKTINISEMKAGDKITQQMTWEVIDFYNNITFSVNKEKYIAESNFKDNDAVVNLDFLVTDKYFYKDPNGMLETKTLFNLGKKDMLELNPAYQLIPPKIKYSGATEMKMETRYLKDPLIIDTKIATEEKNDNKWTIKDGILTCSPLEEPDSLSFAFPTPDSSTTFYDVYITVENNIGYKGVPATKFLAKIENEKDFKPYDYSEQKSQYTTEKFYIGRIDTLDKYFDITFKHSPEQFWTVVYSISLAPAVSKYESPVIYLEDKKFSDRYMSGIFSANTPSNNRITYSYRFGKFKDNKEIVWQDWKLLEEKSQQPKFEFTLPIDGNIFQWNANIYKDTSEEYPYINSFKYKLSATRQGE